MATVYSEDLQKLFLEFMVTDPELFVRVRNIIKPEFFSKKYIETVDMFVEYTEKYKSLPTVEQIKAKTEVDLTLVPDIDDSQKDWFLDEFETFCRHKALERAIIESADMLEAGEYGPVEQKIKDAVRVGLTKDLGTDYFENPKARLLRLKDNNGTVSTGWSALDRKLYGGFNKGELNIFAGSSGAGKSLFLQNLAMNWISQGMHVLYFTFELSEELSSMRIDSMTTGVATNEIFKKIDDVDLSVRMEAKKSGKFQVKYMASGTTANDLRSYLKEYQIQKGITPDVVLIDYLDLMMPTSKRISPADMFLKDKFVSEELRNFAVEQQFVLVTASQLNRSAVEELEYDQSHIAGGISKINTADNVIGIFTSRAMRERGRYQIQFMKTRSSSGVGMKVDLEFDNNSLRIRDLGEDAEKEYKKSANKSSEVMNKIKATSEVNTAQSEEKIVRADVQSSKLNDMLKNLKT